MTLDDLLAFVLPHVKFCPNAVARFHIRQAVIKLCEGSLVWREYQTAVATVADQTAYSYATAAGQRVAKLLSATIDGKDLIVSDPTLGAASGSSQARIFGGMSGFEVRPAPAAGSSIITFAAVAPTLAATTIPDGFAQFAEEVGRGARASIMLVPDEKFTNLTLGAGLQQAFEEVDIPKVRSKAFRGFARSNPRTRSRYF